MKGKLEELLKMNYDPKNIEICVTDGYSTDDLVPILKEYSHHFDQVKYALSDREALPFIIPENNPACDINAQICNVATYNKIIRTDAEVRFNNKNTLSMVSEELDKNKELCMVLPCRVLNAKGGTIMIGVMAGYCSVFTKEAFIRNRGIDERFAVGFAGEDSYFHYWWMKNRPFKKATSQYLTTHLWHGGEMTEARTKLRNNYTLPMIRKFREINMTPNEGNEDWQRPEMIKGVQIWKT